MYINKISMTKNLKQILELETFALKLSKIMIKIKELL